MPRKPVIAVLRVPVKRPANATASLLAQARALGQAGELQQAAERCRQILTVDPRHVEALLQLGTIESRRGHLAQALSWLEQAQMVAPRDATVHRQLGNTLLAMNRLPEALSRFDDALAREPDQPMTWNNRGVVLLGLGRAGDALHSFDRALEWQADAADIWLNRGNALDRLKRPDDAAASYRQALQRRPAFAEAHYRLAVVLNAVKQAGNALDAVDQALALEPDHTGALQLRGALCRRLRQPEAALRCFERLIALLPASADAHNDCGVILQELGRLDEAITAYAQAIALQPGHAGALRNRALALLLVGEFTEGWRLHEWRWQSHAPRPVSGTPEWNGQATQGTLLILPEQGIGDQLFFSGMVPDASRAAGTAASVTLQVDRRLQTLLQRSFADTGVRVIGNDQPQPPHDVHIFLGSLGRHFRSSLDATANARRAWLKASPQRAQIYRETLRTPDSLLYGLSWLSRNGEFGDDKSLALSALTPLLTLPGTRWLNLQYGDTTAERRQLRTDHDIDLIDAAGLDTQDDLDGLAAAISACDVIVTVSNTTAHLAAGLDLPVLILLPYARGLLWYWHRDREDSPWYPSARLFRQPANGDWPSVIAAVHRYLATRAP